MEAIRYCILTASDKGARGERADKSGDIIVQRMKEAKASLIERLVLSDERKELAAQLSKWADEEIADVIFTTGGTGFTARDITPEATADIIERHVPGIAEALRAEGLKKTPHAMLSRGIAGIRKQTLIINLPGSPKAVTEGMEVLKPVLKHAVETLRSHTGVECGNG